jgi:hypothetical protein
MREAIIAEEGEKRQGAGITVRDELRWAKVSD